MGTAGMERLERAMAIWLRHRAASTDESREQVLAAHEDLRDLLEPLFDAEAPPTAEAASSDESETLAPREFDDFRLVRELGSGGMGVVYEAIQRSLDRRVAIKLLRSAAWRDAKSVARFKREALTTARLHHEGIVEVFAVGQHEGGHWFAMELIEGRPLDEFARELHERSPHTAVRTLVEIFAKVAEALAHAHAAGVVHRDIKPSNILVRDDRGTPVLTDFGIARESSLPSVTNTGEINGTPFYMSPEQATGGAAKADARSDVFSLGVTLYEVLTQRRPFDGESSHEVIAQIVHHEPIALDRVVRELPRDLAAIASRALEKDPARRYQTAAEFAEDLQRFLAHRPVLAKPIGRTRRLLRWARREPWRAAMLLSSMVLLTSSAALLGYVWSNQSATAVGQDRLQLRRVEDLFLTAIGARLLRSDVDSSRLVREALALAKDDPYTVAMATEYFANPGRLGPAGALELLREVRASMTADDPGLRRLESELLRKTDQIEAADTIDRELGPPGSALDAYVLAERELKRAFRQGREVAVRARDLAVRAVTTTPNPRASFLITLNRAGRMLGDADTVLAACDALTEHWPDSVAAWAHRAMAWSDYRPESPMAEYAANRSLELAPDNYLGLRVLVDVTRRRGDEAAANRLMSQLQELYPAAYAFEQGGHERSHDPARASPHALPVKGSTGGPDLPR